MVAGSSLPGFGEGRVGPRAQRARKNGRSQQERKSPTLPSPKAGREKVCVAPGECIDQATV
jgi:hypothetical protein